MWSLGNQKWWRHITGELAFHIQYSKLFSYPVISPFRLWLNVFFTFSFVPPIYNPFHLHLCSQPTSHSPDSLPEKLCRPRWPRPWPGNHWLFVKHLPRPWPGSIINIEQASPDHFPGCANFFIDKKAVMVESLFHSQRDFLLSSCRGNIPRWILHTKTQSHTQKTLKISLLRYKHKTSLT